jgi:hypothetical protein
MPCFHRLPNKLLRPNAIFPMSSWCGSPLFALFAPFIGAAAVAAAVRRKRLVQTPRADSLRCGDARCVYPHCSVGRCTVPVLYQNVSATKGVRYSKKITILFRCPRRRPRAIPVKSDSRDPRLDCGRLGTGRWSSRNRALDAEEFEAEPLSHDQDRHVGRRHIPRAERRAHRGQHAAA